MPITIFKYRGYAASSLKERANIPDQADMVVVEPDGYVECSRISWTKVGNGSGCILRRIGGLSNVSSINKWSAFAPIIRTVDGVTGFLVNTLKPTPFPSGEFAGYNHQAITPGYVDESHLEPTWVEALGDATPTVSVDIGEPIYIDGDVEGIDDVVGVALTIWDGQYLIGFWINPLDAEGVIDGMDLTGLIENVAVSKEYTFKIFFVDSLVAFDVNLANVLFQLEELPNYNAWIKVLTVTGWDLSGAFDWVFTEGGEEGEVQFNKVTGRLSFETAVNPNSFTYISMVADLYDERNNEHTYTILYQGAYVAGQEIGPIDELVYAGDLPVPTYGFLLYITVEEVEL